MRTCCKCGEPKDATEFSKNSSKPDGLGTYCKECHRWYLKETRYGIAKDDYENMLEDQAHRCAICRVHKDNAPGKGQLAIDHCHQTGAVRGLLCANCNTAIGKFKDDPQIVIRAARYLTEG